VKKLSLLTGLFCLTGLNIEAKRNLEEKITHQEKYVKQLETCSFDGKIINKRYTVTHKGQRYYACSKACAEELIELLGKV
jgi:hypothetical protein